MAELSEISWCDATFNPVIGCTKVGPGCDHCYAERDFAIRRRVVVWGDDGERHVTSTWEEPRRWQRRAKEFFALHRRRRRVFCASLADVFDKRWPPGVRERLWALIRETPDLDWLLVTKRIGNAEKMFPPDWGRGYLNVTLILTVVNQQEADRDVPKLIDTLAARRGLSIEPQLGAIDLSRWLELGGLDTDLGLSNPGLDWVICGGESGPHARPLDSAWARSLRDQCAAAGVPFHFKQWGEWKPTTAILAPKGGSAFIRLGKKASGRLLDGKEHNGFPRIEDRGRFAPGFSPADREGRK